MDAHNGLSVEIGIVGSESIRMVKQHARRLMHMQLSIRTLFSTLNFNSLNTELKTISAMSILCRADEPVG